MAVMVPPPRYERTSAMLRACCSPFSVNSASAQVTLPSPGTLAQWRYTVQLVHVIDSLCLRAFFATQKSL